MASELDWENLRLFGILHRHPSFSAASRVAKVDATTLSRRLTQLEQELGVLLFQRTTSGLVPTEAAAQIAEHALRIERQIELAREEATGRAQRVEGVVRLALTDETAASFVVPRLSVLRDRHPGLDLEFIVGDGYVDLARGDADIAIRFQLPGRGAPADPGSSVELTARRVATMYVGVYASTSYLARRGRPKDAFDVAGHDLVLQRRDQLPLPGAPWAARVRSVGRPVVRTEGLASMRAAILAGLGIGALPTLLAASAPELTQLGPPEVVDEREIWLVAPADLARVARVRAVWDFLLEIAEDFRRAGSGTKPPAAGRAKSPATSSRRRAPDRG